MLLVTSTVQTKEINHQRTGMRARELRQSQRVSLRALARAMELSAPYVGDLELGRRYWNQDLANRYEAALKLVKNRGF